MLNYNIVHVFNAVPALQADTAGTAEHRSIMIIKLSVREE